MRIGISALLYNLSDALDLCSRIDEINHIEIGLDNLYECKELYRYKERINEMGISIGIHLPMELNTCENVEYIRNCWVDFINKINLELNEFDIRYFNLHLGYVITNRLIKNREKYLENSVKFLQKSNSCIDKKISIENVYTEYGDYSNIGNLRDDFEYIFSKLDNCDRISFCYDIGHDLINKSDYLDKLREKISVVHLSDNDGIQDLHIGIGRGILSNDTITEILELTPEYMILEIDHKYVEESINKINLL